MDRLTFEHRDVTPTSTRAVLKRLKGGEHLVLTGTPGSGRSWVGDVTARETEALQVRFGGALDRGALAAAQLSLQLGTDEPLRAFSEGDVVAAVAAIARRSAGRTVIVDDADPLLTVDKRGGGWLDAVPGMLQPADAAWMSWLTDRDAPTLLIARHEYNTKTFQPIQHKYPSKKTVVWLKEAERGFRDWAAVVKALGFSRPDRHLFASAVLPMLSALELDWLLDEVHGDGELLLQRFGQIFRKRAGRRVAALDVAAALDGTSQVVIQAAIEQMLPDQFADPSHWLRSESCLKDLLDQKLLAASGGRVTVSHAVWESGTIRPLSPRRAGQLARSLLARVNEPADLSPASAAQVLAVHRLAIAAGDHPLALRTATLHVHGLVELARQQSLDGDYMEAWRQYRDLRTMLDAPPASESATLRRTRSYVIHYHAWNGLRAERCDESEALRDSETAVSLWPENARWHGQRIALLGLLGRTVDAWAALNEAEEQVAFHPQRARHLRVYPAARALRHGLVRFGLELLEPPYTWLDDSEAMDIHRGILGRLKKGLEVTQLLGDGCSLSFRQRVSLKVALLRSSKTWRASVNSLGWGGRADSALGALDALVAAAAAEAHALIATPTPRLSDAEADRKGLMLSIVDVLSSDIGLEHAGERWIVGRVEGRRFLPVQASDLPELSLPEGLDGGVGLWFARVPVARDGHPSGEVVALIPAGSSRNASELAADLKALREAG